MGRREVENEKKIVKKNKHRVKHWLRRWPIRIPRDFIPMREPERVKREIIHFFAKFRMFCTHYPGFLNEILQGDSPEWIRSNRSWNRPPIPNVHLPFFSRLKKKKNEKKNEEKTFKSKNETIRNISYMQKNREPSDSKKGFSCCQVSSRQKILISVYFQMKTGKNSK